MARFLLKANYTADGLKGLAKDGGTRRAELVRKMIEDAGGRMESMNFAFGEDDNYVLCELPDQQTATAIAMTVGGAGVATVQITPVLTPEELDEASRRGVNYTPPGQ